MGDQGRSPSTQGEEPKVEHPWLYYRNLISSGAVGKKATAADFEEDRELFEVVLTDKVTGLYNNLFRIPVIESAQLWADWLYQQQYSCWEQQVRSCRWSDQERAEALAEAVREFRKCFYVEIDIRNLGGANSHLGHQGANAKVLQPIAERLRRALYYSTHQQDRWFRAFRHGGDEVSVVIGGFTERQLTVIFDGLRREIDRYIEAEELQTVPHTKENGKPGIGIVYGFSELTATEQLTEIFSRADKRVEQCKRGLGKLGFGE